MAIDGKFTVGMIFAFQSYKSQFLGAAMRLVGQWVQFRLLDVHLTRIGDIAMSPAENDGGTALHKPALEGQIEIRDLHFAYGLGEKKVLKGVNLSIEPGETVALIGSSGGGKTTLMKLLLGFYTPDKGEILIDGEPLDQFGLRRFRTQIGAVLQEDALYAGSVAENISFFDAEADIERVKYAARLACIHDEIMAMPMGFESLIGNMGSTLSGGQKQRVLLARALLPCIPCWKLPNSAALTRRNGWQMCSTASAKSIRSIGSMNCCHGPGWHCRPKYTFGVGSARIRRYHAEMSANDYDLELEQLGTRATARLLMADVFDGAAFDALYDHLAGKADALRGESVLSKQILACLRQASQAIRSRAEYLPAARDSIAVADKFEMLLDLLITGQDPADRKPGIPRIV